MNPDRLTIFYDDDGTFVDLTEEMEDFGRDSFVVPMVSSEDKLYIGFYKPFSRFYIEMEAPDDQSATILMEQYTTSWNQNETLRDKTRGMSRSGFMMFEPLDGWSKTTINGKEMFWVRLFTDTDFNILTSIQGIGMIFSTDEDLIEEYSDIKTDFLPDGFDSFILKHQSARKDIMQEIRNRGRRKVDSDNNLVHVTAFDVLLPDSELRQASKYLALSKIFFNVSNDPDGVYRENARKYEEKYASAFDYFYLSLDVDDDGVKDEGESLAFRVGTIRRV